jgi:hypothetical protein
MPKIIRARGEGNQFIALQHTVPASDLGPSSVRPTGHEAALGASYRPLKPPPASSKDQEKNDYQQDKVEAAATVIAEPWAHIVPATAKEQEKDHENDYQSHGQESSMDR